MGELSQRGREALVALEGIGDMLRSWTVPPTTPPCMLWPGQAGEKQAELHVLAAMGVLFGELGQTRRKLVLLLGAPALWCMWQREQTGMVRYGRKARALMVLALEAVDAAELRRLGEVVETELMAAAERHGRRVEPRVSTRGRGQGAGTFIALEARAEASFMLGALWERARRRRDADPAE